MKLILLGVKLQKRHEIVNKLERKETKNEKEILKLKKMKT